MLKAFGDLDKVVREKKIVLTYPKGYKTWKRRFDEVYKKTKSVSQALDEIHGREPEKGGK